MVSSILQRNNVTVTGQGSSALVFAHGFGCDQVMWRHVAPTFADTHRVVLFGYVGAGRSDVAAYDPRRYSRLDGYAEDVLDVCAALDLEDVIFVGHSVSSMIGILASLREPARFARLVLIGPSPCYLDDPPAYFGGFKREDLVGLLDLMEKNYLGWARYLAPLIMKNPDRPDLARELDESFCSTDSWIARQFAEATFFSDYRSSLPQVRVPSLILQCSEDALAPVGVGEYMHREMPGSTYRRMKATGHCPHVSHPEETIALIQEYLRASVPEVG
jgi:sigma-B regulation protein RsbQ